MKSVASSGWKWSKREKNYTKLHQRKDDEGRSESREKLAGSHDAEQSAHVTILCDEVRS